MSANKRFVDDEGQFLGPSPAGFKMRPDDKGGLSVTEIERFGEFGDDAIMAGAVAYRESLTSKKLGAQAVFAWAQISAAKAAAEGYGKQIRVVHDPVEGNPGHAEIRHFDEDDMDLLDHFATDVFTEYKVVAEMGLPSN